MSLKREKRWSQHLNQSIQVGLIVLMGAAMVYFWSCILMDGRNWVVNMQRKQEAEACHEKLLEKKKELEEERSRWLDMDYVELKARTQFLYTAEDEQVIVGLRPKEDDSNADNSALSR